MALLSLNVGTIGWLVILAVIMLNMYILDYVRRIDQGVTTIQDHTLRASK